MHYSIKSFRISDKLYKRLKNKRPKNLSWNQFFSDLLKEWERKNKKTKEKTELEK